MTTTLPTAAEYAAELVRLVRDELDAEPVRYADARSWEDLQDVCDANDFLIDADDTFSIPFNPTNEVWCVMVNAAVQIAEADLWPADA